MCILVLYLVCHSPVSGHLGQIHDLQIFSCILLSFNGVL